MCNYLVYTPDGSIYYRFRDDQESAARDKYAELLVRYPAETIIFQKVKI